jgi:hypothetical protein
MIVKTDVKWALSRVFWIGIAALGILTGQIVLGITLLILTLQRSLHEFAHAVVIVLTGGIVNYIALGPGHDQFIHFHARDHESEAMIYFAGVLFDSLCIGFCTAMLMLNKDLLNMILGYALFLMMLFFHLVPEQSDFNVWKRIINTA